jgi:diguanylate cyclase (GGDEF)-like protein
MLDLDRFKEVNDTYGHLRGDDLLRTVAQTMRGVTRSTDVVCRYAGDEFVLLLPNTTLAVARAKAEEIRAAVDNLPPAGPGVKVSASVGVAHYPDDGTDSRALISAADQRMYEDKLQRRRARDMQEEDFRLRSTTASSRSR